MRKFQEPASRKPKFGPMGDRIGAPPKDTTAHDRLHSIVTGKPMPEPVAKPHLRPRPEWTTVRVPRQTYEALKIIQGQMQVNEAKYFSTGDVLARALTALAPDVMQTPRRKPAV